MDDWMVTHAGHPLNADRWCINETCNALAVEQQARLTQEDDR